MSRRPANAVKPTRSRLRIPRSATMIATTLSAASLIPIHHYPVIATKKNIDGLMDVGR